MQIHKNKKLISDVVNYYYKLVKKIAYQELHKISKFTNNLELNDLIQSGVIGLLEATRKYDIKRESSFPIYVWIKIKGNILDDIRRNTWYTRSDIKKLNIMNNARKKIENRIFRKANHSEVAKEMGMSQTNYNMFVKGLPILILNNINQTLWDNEFSNFIVDEGKDPILEIEQEELYFKIKNYIENLPYRDRLILKLYYVDSLNLKEIGNKLKISEARVSQIHSKLFGKIKSILI